MILDEVIAARMKKDREAPRISEGDNVGFARIVADVECVKRSYLRFGSTCFVDSRTQMRLEDCRRRQLLSQSLLHNLLH